MKYQILSLSDKNRKVVGFTDDKLMFSSKRHDDIKSLNSSAQKSGMMESVKVIDTQSISGVSYNEKDGRIFVNYTNDKGKEKKESFELLEDEYVAPYAEALAELRGFTRNVSSESKTMPLLYNLGGIALTAFFTWTMYATAIDAQNGIEPEVSGGRRGFGVLLGKLAGLLGPIGVIILGSVIGLVLAYLAYKRFSNPPAVVEFK